MESPIIRGAMMITYTKDMTVQEALNYAAIYGLQNEVQQCLDDGLTPEQALREWDL